MILAFSNSVPTFSLFAPPRTSTTSMSCNKPSSDNDVRMEEDKGPSPTSQFPDNWIYLKPVDLVMHAPQTCPTCDSMSNHMLLAMSQHLTSFEKAMEERTRGLSKQLRSAEGKIRELQFTEEELNHKLRSLRRENNELRDDLQRDRSRGRAMPMVALPHRSVPYDLAHHNNETRRKVQQVREERGIRSYSAVVQSSGPPPPNMSAVRPAVPPQAKAKMVSQR